MFNGPQNPGPIRGSNPLIYTGSTPNMVIMNRRPNPTDIAQFELGHWWIIPIDTTFTTGEVWTLVSKAEGIATWKKLHGGGGPTPPTNTYVINKIYLTTLGAGTYTPTTGMKQCYVECQAGGGGTFYDSGTGATGQCGGGGGYVAKLYTDIQIGSSQSYSIGSGGTPNAFNDFSAAGSTTFGSGGTLITAMGGFNNNGLGSASSSGGDLIIEGGNGFFIDVATVLYTAGGSSVLGASSGMVIGKNGNNYGAGSNRGSSGTTTGGQGIIIITEYLA